MTPILTRLARAIDDALGGIACINAITASKADLSLVHWRFLAKVLRAMPRQPADMQAVIDPVITGMDRLWRGEEWPEAEAAWAAKRAAERAVAADAPATMPPLAVTAAAMAVASDAADAAAWAARGTWAAPSLAGWAVEAAALWATAAGITYAHQRDILIWLIEEAGA